MRAFLGVGRVAPICALQGDLGWAPMVVYTKCEVVKLWHRLCSLPSTRISSKIFRWLGNLRRKNWVRSTRHLMQNVELPLHAINCTSRKAIGDQAWEAFASHHGLEWKNRVGIPRQWKPLVEEDYLSIKFLSPLQVQNPMWQPMYSMQHGE